MSSKSKKMSGPRRRGGRVSFGFSRVGRVGTVVVRFTVSSIYRSAIIQLLAQNPKFGACLANASAGLQELRQRQRRCLVIVDQRDIGANSAKIVGSIRPIYHSASLSQNRPI
jgi:hypothetical protein